MSRSKATSMSNTGMSGQWTALLAAATILFAAALHPVRANAQQGGAPTNLHHAQQVQAAVEGGEKASQDANVTPLMSKPLPDFPGKEVLMLTVTYPPGGSDPVYRHH